MTTCTYCTLADIVPPRPAVGRTQLGTPICRECANIMVLDVYDFPEDDTRYCPDCENVVQSCDTDGNIYHCGACKRNLFESETDTRKGQTKNKR